MARYWQVCFQLSSSSPLPVPFSLAPDPWPWPWPHLKTGQGFLVSWRGQGTQRVWVWEWSEEGEGMRRSQGKEKSWQKMSREFSRRMKNCYWWLLLHGGISVHSVVGSIPLRLPHCSLGFSFLPAACRKYFHSVQVFWLIRALNCLGYLTQYSNISIKRLLI